MYQNTHFIYIGYLKSLTLVNCNTYQKKEINFEQNIVQIHGGSGNCQYIFIELSEDAYFLDIKSLQLKQFQRQNNESVNSQVIICKGENQIAKGLIIDHTTNQVRKAIFKEKNDHFIESPIKQQSISNLNTAQQKQIYLELSCDDYLNNKYIAVILDVLFYVNQSNLHFYDLKTQQNVPIDAQNDLFNCIPLVNNEDISITPSLQENQFIIYSKYKIIGCNIERSQQNQSTNIQIRFILSRNKINQLISLHINQKVIEQSQIQQEIDEIEYSQQYDICGATEFTRDQIVILVNEYICILSQQSHKLLALLKHDFQDKNLFKIQNIIVKKSMQNTYICTNEISNNIFQQNGHLITCLLILTQNRVYQLTPVTVLDQDISLFNQMIIECIDKNNIDNQLSQCQSQYDIKSIKPFCGRLVEYYKRTQNYVVIQIFNQIIAYLLKIKQVDKAIKVLQFAINGMDLDYFKYYTILLPIFYQEGLLSEFIHNWSLESSVKQQRTDNDLTKRNQDHFNIQLKHQTNILTYIVRFILNVEHNLIQVVLPKISQLLQYNKQSIVDTLEEFNALQAQLYEKDDNYNQQKQLSQSIVQLYDIIHDSNAYFNYLLQNFGISSSIDFCLQKGKLSQLLNYFNQKQMNNDIFKFQSDEIQSINEYFLSKIAIEISKQDSDQQQIIEGSLNLIFNITDVDDDLIQQSCNASLIQRSLLKLLAVLYKDIGMLQESQNNSLSTIQILIQNNDQQMLKQIQQLQQFLKYLALSCKPSTYSLIKFFISEANEIIYVYAMGNSDISFILLHMTFCIHYYNKNNIYSDIVILNYYFQQYYQQVIDPTMCQSGDIVYQMLFNKRTNSSSQSILQQIQETINRCICYGNISNISQKLFNYSTLQLINNSNLPYISYFMSQQAIDEKQLSQLCSNIEVDRGQFVCGLINFYYINKNAFNLKDQYFKQFIYELLNNASDVTSGMILHKLLPDLITKISINDTNNASICMNLLLNEQLQSSLLNQMESLIIYEQLMSTKIKIQDLQAPTSIQLQTCSLCNQNIDHHQYKIIIYRCGHVFHQKCNNDSQTCKICQYFIQ